MLKDAEVVVLRNNVDYKTKTSTGLKNIVADLINCNKGDFKPDISFFVKLAYGLAKARIIRKELVLSSRDLLERILNYELKWPRTPDSVRGVCEAQKESFIWMRYDAPRVEALFSHSRSLISDAEFRDLIKRHSTIEADKNVRLAEIAEELKLLLRVTLRSIGSKGLFDSLVGLNAKEFYEDNEAEIQQKFLNAARRGSLGLLPGGPMDDDNA